MLQGTAEVKLGERATEREREGSLQSFVVKDKLYTKVYTKVSRLVYKESLSTERL